MSSVLDSVSEVAYRCLVYSEPSVLAGFFIGAWEGVCVLESWDFELFLAFGDFWCVVEFCVVFEFFFDDFFKDEWMVFGVLCSHVLMKIIQSSPISLFLLS